MILPRPAKTARLSKTVKPATRARPIKVNMGCHFDGSLCRSLKDNPMNMPGGLSTSRNKRATAVCVVRLAATSPAARLPGLLLIGICLSSAGCASAPSSGYTTAYQPVTAAPFAQSSVAESAWTYERRPRRRPALFARSVEMKSSSMLEPSSFPLADSPRFAAVAAPEGWNWQTCPRSEYRTGMVREVPAAAVVPEGWHWQATPANATTVPAGFQESVAPAPPQESWLLAPLNSSVCLSSSGAENAPRHAAQLRITPMGTSAP
jgi:hypothetical protein